MQKSIRFRSIYNQSDSEWPKLITSQWFFFNGNKSLFLLDKEFNKNRFHVMPLICKGTRIRFNKYMQKYKKYSIRLQPYSCALSWPRSYVSIIVTCGFPTIVQSLSLQLTMSPSGNVLQPKLENITGLPYSTLSIRYIIIYTYCKIIIGLINHWTTFSRFKFEPSIQS